LEWVKEMKTTTIAAPSSLAGGPHTPNPLGIQKNIMHFHGETVEMHITNSK
jgi:hypothetical protein